MIVEDDLSVMKLLVMLLEGFGFQVIETALNGEIAVKKFISLAEKPDIILMDYRMPIKNGIDASIEIIKINDHAKIIFATADERIKDRALKIGAIDVISKPFDFEKLIESINRAIGKVPLKIDNF